MAIRLPVDIATRVSPELSEFIETLVNDPDRDEPPTLGSVRNVLLKSGGAELAQEELLHPQQRTSLLAEVNDLIDEYGKEVLAIDFVADRASEALSRIIEAVIDDASVPHERTLGAVRRAMAGGLTASLVGLGTIDPDQDDTLLAEIDELIRRYGPTIAAEGFVRFE